MWAPWPWEGGAGGSRKSCCFLGKLTVTAGLGAVDLVSLKLGQVWGGGCGLEGRGRASEHPDREWVNQQGLQKCGF